MNLNQRRPSSSRSYTWDKFNKSDFIELINDNGWELRRGEVLNRGEWNEHRRITANKGDQEHLVACQGKGERIDWDAEAHHFMKTVLGWKTK